MGCSNSKVEMDSTNKKREVTPPMEETPVKKKVASLKIGGLDSNVSIKTLTFKHVMSDSLGREYFMQFLKIEHAEENLTFFQEVETLKKVDDKNLYEQVDELVEQFLKPGVETEVNISDNMKKNILVLVTKEEHNYQRPELMKYLDKAQNEILMIMAMGAFPRFMKHNLFMDYKIAAAERDASAGCESFRDAERTS